MKKKQKILVLLFLLFYGKSFASGVQEGSVFTSAETLHDLSQTKLRILDIRAEKAYNAGHVPGAVSASYKHWYRTRNGLLRMLPDTAEIEALIQKSGIDSDTHVIIVSASSPDGISAAARVFWTLKAAGIANISILDGGFSQWEVKNFRISAEAELPRPGTHSVQALDRTILATHKEVETAISDENTMLQDARPEQYFEGRKKHRRVKLKGTIEGAVNLPYSSLLKNDHTVVSRAETEEYFENLNASHKKSIIVFCNAGHWSALNWLLLTEYLGKKVKLYDASMVEWANINPQTVVNFEP